MSAIIESGGHDRPTVTETIESSDLTPILFFTGDYAFLSNFYGGPIAYNGHSYPTVEHAYQAAKTTTEADRRQIEKALTATAAKAIGRTVKCRTDWDEVRLSVMTELIQTKFADPRLRMRLVETGDRELVHGSPYDYPGLKFWGAVVVSRPGVEAGERRWEGENMLGEILMAVREEVRGL